jgi:hypothetical protein
MVITVSFTLEDESNTFLRNVDEFLKRLDALTSQKTLLFIVLAVRTTDVGKMN